MKNSSDTIGNRSRKLPVCSCASTTAPPLAPYIYIVAASFKTIYEIPQRYDTKALTMHMGLARILSNPSGHKTHGATCKSAASS
jgi:hypothetical protein